MELEKIEKIIQLMFRYNLGEIDLQEGDKRLKLTHPGMQRCPELPLPPKCSQQEVGYRNSEHLFDDHSERDAASLPRSATLTNSPKTEQGKTTLAREKTTSRKTKEIQSPFVGTFYRSANPGTSEYVKVGSKIKPGDVLCIVEAMKLMNEIESDVSGTIVDILAQNEQAIEFGQPLFLVDLHT